MSDDFSLIAQELIKAGRFIDSRGWVPATSGNFSARLADGTIAITVSGRHKGRLTPADIMRVDFEGRSLDGQRPSAETLLHTALYRRFPQAGAVLHPHSPGSIVLSRLATGGQVRLENYELLKALSGIETHEQVVILPIFPNDQDIARLSRRVDQWIDEHGDTRAYIIDGHGFYTWGDTVMDALRHVEALEFLFDIESRLYGARTR